MEAGIWSLKARLLAEKSNETRFEDEEEKKWAWIVSREREYGGGGGPEVRKNNLAGMSRRQGTPQGRALVAAREIGLGWGQG